MTREECCFMTCDNVWSGRSVPAFQIAASIIRRGVTLPQFS